MKKDDMPFLSQLIKSMLEAEIKLEKAYENKNADAFNQTKGVMIEIQKKISEILENG